MRAALEHGDDARAASHPAAESARPVAAPARVTTSRRVLSRPSMLGLQRSAGNGAVARLMADRRSVPSRSTADEPASVASVGAVAEVAPTVQRRAEGGSCPPPPQPPTPSSPKEEPRFAKVEADIRRTAKSIDAHPRSTTEARKAADAAEPPAGDLDAQAKASHSDKMAGAKPGAFDKKAFIAAVKAAIASKAPKNLDEADKFTSSGKADSVKSEVMDKVTKGKEGSAKEIATTTAQTPDTSAAKPKPVVPIKDAPPAKPAPPKAAAAMPARAPADETDMRSGACETDSQMADAGVTEEQLAKSNEPELTDALAAKKEGEQHSATAPAQVRANEADTLQAAGQGADQAGRASVESMVGTRANAQSGVSAGRSQAKAKDEQARAEITAKIKSIFDATKTDVEKILTDLDTTVASKFEAGEKAAKDAFTADHTARMERYKDDRYSGVTGWARWTADLFAGMPAEANQIFLESKKLYESKMEVVISDVADHIGKELQRAKDRVAKGRKEIADYVASKPKALQKVARQAAGEIGSQFDELDSEIDSKQESLVDDLATRYTEARNAVDEEIKELQAANRGLWDKAKDAIGGAIQTILKLKAMLLGVLARAAGAVGKIIKDPIGFLGNLIGAVKAGVTNFATNILEHLKKGLQAWLFGALANAGIEIPETFDLKGIIKLVLSILGLTWTKIRTRIVARIGEAAMNAVEQGVDFFKTLVTEGIGGLWRFLIDKLSDLKDTVMEAIQDFVVVKIVKAGITWLISALNPAAAFIKACKMIYDVVMFFVEKGQQIKDFVDSVLDSIESIVSGGVGKVASLIEGTLAKILPLLLGFLASLLGLGGISEKIREILENVQKPVMKVVDGLIKGALKLAAPIINLAKRGIAWTKGKIEKGKAWVKGKVEKGKAALGGAAAGGQRAASVVADAAAKLAGKPSAVTQIRDRAVEAGAQHLRGEGRIVVSGVPPVQRTTAEVNEAPRAVPEAEEVRVRSAQPTKPGSAAQILAFVKSRMPALLAEFAKPEHSRRGELDRLEARFTSFMEGKRDRPLTKAERAQAMRILDPARSLSREYYNRFRDFTWSRLNADPAFLALVEAPGSGAQAGSKNESLKIEVVVTRADGSQVKQFRSVDFEHITRVVDQPFHRHSGAAGENPNLTPMLGDLNRYFQEAIRNIAGAHMFGSDAIEQFIVQHQLYSAGSPALREIEFEAAG